MSKEHPEDKNLKSVVYNWGETDNSPTFTAKKPVDIKTMAKPANKVPQSVNHELTAEEVDFISRKKTIKRNQGGVQLKVPGDYNPRKYISPFQKVGINPEDKIKCGGCKCTLEKLNNIFIKNEESRESDYVCDTCAEKLFTCSLCSTKFSNKLEEGYCKQCIATAPERYIQGYQTKAERHIEKLLSKADDKTKFCDKSIQEMFGNNSPKSFALTVNGLVEVKFGVELEYETTNSLGLGAIKVSNLVKNIAILKRDRTLAKGFEVVSAPADKQFHYNAWDNFFQGIENDDNIYCAQFDPATEKGCGCHIHISKDSLVNQNTYGKDYGEPGLAIAKIISFIHHPNNRKFIEVMAGRPSNMYSDFTKKRGPQIVNGRIVSGIKDITRQPVGVPNHRTAINFESSNGKTVEFRIFRSTKNRLELLKNIDFVDAICYFSRTGNSSLLEMSDWIHFWEFVCKNRQDYPYLYKFSKTDPQLIELIRSRN